MSAGLSCTAHKHNAERANVQHKVNASNIIGLDVHLLHHWPGCTTPCTSIGWRGVMGEGEDTLLSAFWRQRHMGPHGEIKHLFVGVAQLARQNSMQMYWIQHAQEVKLPSSHWKSPRSCFCNLCCDSHRDVRSDKLARDSHIPGDRLWCPRSLTKLCNFQAPNWW